MELGDVKNIKVDLKEFEETDWNNLAYGTEVILLVF